MKAMNQEEAIKHISNIKKFAESIRDSAGNDENIRNAAQEIEKETETLMRKLNGD